MKKLKIAALLLLFVFINVAAAGCLSDEPTKTPKLDISLVGGSHKIFAGDTTTYVILIDNNRNENDTVTLSVKSAPSGWDVTLNLTTFALEGDSSFGIFVVIKSKENAQTGDHKVKIEVLSNLFGSKKSLSINTKVISDTGKRVIIGDKVAVDYLGYLEAYKVFDTSLEKIGNNRAIQKTPDFSPRAVYDDLLVYVGAEDSDTKDSYISTVEGFWEAIEGMRVGQSRTVFLPPEKGYGNFVNTTLNITEEIKMLETITIEEFETYYPNEKLFEGVSMKHYFWDWNISIDYFNETEDFVRLLNEPYLNEVIAPYGWTSKVTYKNQSDFGGEGRIIISHEPQSGEEAVYLGFPAIVDSVAGDQINIRYNDSTHDLGNEVLIFDIALVAIQG
jgi:FKBP-type peptidyl-prolyl cis-trans isomerase 2